MLPASRDGTRGCCPNPAAVTAPLLTQPRCPPATPEGLLLTALRVLDVPLVLGELLVLVPAPRTRAAVTVPVFVDRTGTLVAPDWNSEWGGTLNYPLKS